jgi:hypothetical protein
MSSRWYWWNLIEWSSVALATEIGTVTNPKLIAPFQMFRGMADLRGYPEQHQAMRATAAAHVQDLAAAALLGA